jgi:hypothetical protein
MFAEIFAPGCLGLQVLLPPGFFPKSEDPSPIEDKFKNPMLLPVVLPRKLIEDFILLSNENTQKNIETLGYLAGREVDGRLLVSMLIVPP